MDWFTVALLILFFVLPLIQQVLNKGGEQQAPEMDPDELEGAPRRKPRQVAMPAPDRESSGDWAEEWTPWPTQEEGHPDDAEVLEPEPTPWSPPVPVSVEAPYRMPEMPTSPEPLPYEPSRELTLLGRDESLPPAAPRLARPRSLPAARPARIHSAIQLHGGTRELKRAIVLREVLGPPTALRSPDQERPW